jgi:cell division protein FtsI (penicillin-binding protein 3)
MPKGARKKKQEPSPEQLQSVHRVRIYAVFAVFLAVFSIISIRLIHLQTDPGQEFDREDEYHVVDKAIRRPRGDIFDRNHRLLATDTAAYSLWADPKKVEDPKGLAAFLRGRLGRNEEELHSILTARTSKGKKKRFVYLKKWMSHAELDALGDLSEAPSGNALDTRKETIRYYPERDLAAQVLGFVNREGVGSEGLEQHYDKYLRSHAGRKESRIDRHRRMLDFLTLEYEPPTGGDDIYLTIDAVLQYALERALDEAMLDKNAPRAMGLLMDPQTGAILALASRPGFDPNRYNEFTAELRKNKAVVDVFEPGSAFKLIGSAAALELGLVRRDDPIDCEGGSFRAFRRRIYDTHERNVIPFSQTFAESSNIAAIKVATLLGEERYEAWIRRFGIGRATGIDLPQESAGLFSGREYWSKLSMISLPMGQEVALNMLQLGVAFSAVANGGYLVEPYTVSRALSPEGEETYSRATGRGAQIMSEKTANIMKELCYQVIAGKESTGRHAVIAEYKAGGKTGTAQIAREDGRGYYKRKYTAVFAGFAPISNPRITCVVVVQEPEYGRGRHYGGSAAGPVFKKVVREALIRLHVPQEPMDVEGELESIGSYAMQDADTMVPHQELPFLEPMELGNAAFPRAMELLPSRENPTSEGGRLPDFTGMSKRQAKKLAVRLKLQWDPQGAGRVLRQNPAPGTPLDDVDICQLVFTSHSGPVNEV